MLINSHHMKFSKILALLVFVAMGAAFSACNASQDKPETVLQASAEVVLDIEGMTCEMGCKKAIEKVLSNTDGVATGKVVYEEGKAYVSFDPAVVDETAIITAINESYQGAYKATKALN